MHIEKYKILTYHRTNMTLDDIRDGYNKDFFGKSKGSMYGKGLYQFYNLKSLVNNYKLSVLNETYDYGKNVIQNIVNIENYLIFDYFYSIKILKMHNYDICEICKSRDVEIFNNTFYNHTNYGKDFYTLKELNELLKRHLINSSFVVKMVIDNSDVIQKFDGVIFTGRNDGRVLVTYNLDTVIPIRFSEINSLKFNVIKNI